MMSIDNAFRAAFLAAAVFGCSPASALDTQAAWEGFMQVTAATPACAAQHVGGSAVGDVHVSVYRPHILPTDTKHSFLSVVFLHAAFTLENTSEPTNPQMRNSGLDTTWIIDGRGAAAAVPGLVYNFTVTPNIISLSDSTPYITITGTIFSYFSVNNCNVTFTAQYVKE
jgi:hypothetical protein